MLVTATESPAVECPRMLALQKGQELGSAWRDFCCSAHKGRRSGIRDRVLWLFGVQERLKILSGCARGKEAVKFLGPERNSAISKCLKGGKGRERGKGREMLLNMFPSGSKTLIFRAA